MPTALEPLAVALLEEARQSTGVGAFVRGLRETEPDGPDAVEPIDSGVMTRGAPGCWWNQAMGLGMNGPVAAADLDRLVAFYVEHGIEPRIEMASVAHRSLMDGLRERDFQLRDIEHVLAVDLSEPLPPNPHGEPVGIEVVQLHTPADPLLNEAADVYAGGFADTPHASADSARDRENSLKSLREGLRIPEYVAIVARDAGKLVAFSAMEVRDGSAGLFGGCVMPSHRRRGIQAQLILARMAIARERGAAIATIGSHPGIPTERNAARLGFRLGYCKLVMAVSGPGLAPSR